MSSYWSDFVKDLEPYSPGEQPQISNITKLNTNENPYGPSPAVIKAISEAADDRLRLYPPPEAEQLKSKIAEQFQSEFLDVHVARKRLIRMHVLTMEGTTKQKQTTGYQPEAYRERSRKIISRSYHKPF